MCDRLTVQKSDYAWGITMKTRMVKIREGEYLGKVDWAYDFSAHDWDHGGGTNPISIRDAVMKLKFLEYHVGKWQATVDGGMPRCGCGDVIAVGMYDGWPYWRPVPSFQISTQLGPEWHSFCMLSDIRPMPR